MLYYINVTSWNLIESFVTESLSPHIFYSERSYGNNLSRHFDKNNELCNYLVLTTRETTSDYSILIDEDILDKESIVPVSSHKTLFTYGKTIYFRKGAVQFRFATKELMNSLIAECHILLDVKCVEKYSDCFFISDRGHKPIEVSTRLADSNGFSFDFDRNIRKDNHFNIVKGMLIGYARGILTTSNNEEQALKLQLVSLKNSFAGINTSIMVNGEGVKNPETILFAIRQAKQSYDAIRDVKTNLFDVLSHQFNEVVKLAEERSKLIMEVKSSGSEASKRKLESERSAIQSQIFRIEVDNNIGDYYDELQAIKDQERMNGRRVGKERQYFKKGTPEYERKQFLKDTIERFKRENSEYAFLLKRIDEINQRLSEIDLESTQYDNVILGIFSRISDIMNDLIKKVNDTEDLNNVDFSDVEVLPNGGISIRQGCGIGEAERDYLNITLSYLIEKPFMTTVSDAAILKLIVESAREFKSLDSAKTKDGMSILQTLRDFWCYKNQKVSTFAIPDSLPVLQAIMAFYVKPYGFDQIERYILNKHYGHKAYAFMLWGGFLGYAALPKTFTSVIYQDDEVSRPIDNYLKSVSDTILSQVTE